MIDTATRVFVLPLKGRETEIQALKAMIGKAGCQIICDQAPPSQWEKCLSDSDVMVILICKEAMEDATIDKFISMASHEGKRVVGVWAKDAKDGTIPAAINRHGDAVISLDPELVKGVVCGGKSMWTTPDGKPRAAPKTPRHKG
jgi:hypothetical protein